MQLYRYRPINSQLRDLVVAGRAWFASPRSFNDPFDCRLPVLFEPTEKRLLRLLRDATARLGISKSEVMSRYQAAKKQGAKALEAFVTNIRDVLRNGTLDTSSILCFSEHQADILMFAHYGDQHRGVSVGFDADALVQTGKLLKVKYEAEYPELDFLKLRDDPVELLRSLFLTKAKQWEYEAEYRMLRHNQPEGFATFDPEFIVSVTFGCECSVAKADDVRLWCKQANRDIRFFQAVKSETKFRLEIIDA